MPLSPATLSEILDKIVDAERNIAPLVEREGHVATCPAVGTTKACSQRCLQVRMAMIRLDEVHRALTVGLLVEAPTAAPPEGSFTDGLDELIAEEAAAKAKRGAA